MILSGILLTPTGVPFSNSLVRITANITSPDVLQFVQKDFRTDVLGAYSVDVPNGWYHVSVYVNDFRAFTNIGNIEITTLTTQTTINELLMIGQTAHSDPLVTQVAADAASALASKNAAALSETNAGNSATAAANSASSASSSAATVSAKTARFLANNTVNPTVRDDGSPLQLGDQYFNTSTNVWNTYTASGWITNNLLVQMTWTQSSPSSTWTIPHNLNSFPTITVVDNAGNKVEADLKYVDSNILQIIFGTPFAGKAYIN